MPLSQFIESHIRLRTKFSYRWGRWDTLLVTHTVSAYVTLRYVSGGAAFRLGISCPACCYNFGPSTQTCASGWHCGRLTDELTAWRGTKSPDGGTVAYTVKSRLRGMVLAASEMASKKAKKRNFSETEVHVLVGEIQAKQHIIFRSHGPGLTNKRKHIEWQKITAAVNQAGAAGRTVKEIRKKWTDLKREATKRIVAHRLHVADTGEGPAPPSLSSVDDIISEIIGTESTDGVMPPEEEKFGVTYTGSTQTAHEPDSENDSKEAVFAVTDPVSITTAGASAAPVRASLSFSGPAPTSVSSAQGSSSRAPTSPAGVIRDWEGVDVITDTLLQSQRETLRVQRDVAAGIGAIVQRLEAMQEAHTAAIGALTDAVRALNDTIKDFKK